MKIENLKGIIPDNVFAELPSVMEKFKIDSVLRLSHFLAQCAHESGGFKFFKENLNYSTEGLMKTFPKYFPTIEIANQYARQPDKIANKVYASRMGNGDEASGDGARFKGRGAIQLTGRDNYTKFDKVVPENIIDVPDFVATKYPLLSAAFFWGNNKLNTIADFGDKPEDVRQVSKRVNGGLHGIEQRIEKFNLFYSKLNLQ